MPLDPPHPPTSSPSRPEAAPGRPGSGPVAPPRSAGRASGEFGAQAENARRENARSNSRAARTVAGRSQDAQDCRLLLEMLGLDTRVPEARGPADD